MDNQDYLRQTLKENDPEIYGIMKKEDERQRAGLEMIASENFTSRAVMEALGSCFTNKYSEGKVGNRYYGGNKFIDEMEVVCKTRALAAFKLVSIYFFFFAYLWVGSPPFCNKKVIHIV